MRDYWRLSSTFMTVAPIVPFVTLPQALPYVRGDLARVKIDPRRQRKSRSEAPS